MQSHASGSITYWPILLSFNKTLAMFDVSAFPWTRIYCLSPYPRDNESSLRSTADVVVQGCHVALKTVSISHRHREVNHIYCDLVTIDCALVSIGVPLNSVNQRCHNSHSSHLSKVKQTLIMMSQCLHPWIITFNSIVADLSLALVSWHNGSIPHCPSDSPETPCPNPHHKLHARRT